MMGGKCGLGLFLEEPARKGELIAGTTRNRIHLSFGSLIATF